MDLFTSKDALKRTDIILKMLIRANKLTFGDFIGTNWQNARLDSIMLCAINLD